MEFKEILVHATHGDDCGARLKAATDIAARLDARLTAIYTLWIPPMPGYVEARLGRKLLLHQRELHEQHADRVRTLFEEVTTRAGVAAQWRTSDEPRARALSLNARYCDLLVMGRHQDDSPTPTVSLVEAVIMDSPKPVMLLPDDVTADVVGGHVMVAWNGSREAVRAVDASLPLLVRANTVDVVSVNPRIGENDQHGDVAGMDLCAHLAHHDVRAEAHAMDSGPRGVGETLLARAMATGCDLLVMGAYGHARWQEVVLGGATAHILKHARIPLLLTH